MGWWGEGGLRYSCVGTRDWQKHMNWIELASNRSEIQHFLDSKSESLDSCSILRVTAWGSSVDIYLEGVEFAIPSRWVSRGFNRPILKLSFFEVSDVKVEFSPSVIGDVSAQFESRTRFLIGQGRHQSNQASPLVDIRFGSLLAKVMGDPAELSRHMEPASFASDFDQPA